MSCTQCNKPICERHMRYSSDKPTCISCVRGGLANERTERGRPSAGYESDPYFFYYYYGSRGGEGFGDDDFELFDGGGDAGAAYAMDDDGAWVGS